MKDGKLKKHSSIVQPSKSRRHCNALDVILGKYNQGLGKSMSQIILLLKELGLNLLFFPLGQLS